jgi:hypothetical protein
MNWKLTYHQKVKALPSAFLCALLIIYLVAIKDVLKLHQDCSELNIQISKATDAPKETLTIRSKLNEINLIAGKSKDPENTDPLLEFISASSINKTIQLVEYQPVHQYKNQSNQIETRIACFEGSFSHLLKLLYRLEKEFKAGKVVSVKYQTETDFKTNKTRLLMTLYIQSITNDKEEINVDQNAS